MAMERSLTQKQIVKAQGAVLEGASFSAEQIARLCNVSVPSVKRWRRDPEYQKAAEEAASRHLEDLHPVIEALKIEVSGAAAKAVKVLSEAMDKKDPEGFPHRNAIDAARTALSQLKLVTGEDSTDGDRGSQTAVIVIPEGKLAEESKPATSVESTAIEIPDEEA